MLVFSVFWKDDKFKFRLRFRRAYDSAYDSDPIFDFHKVGNATTPLPVKTSLYSRQERQAR